MEQQVAPTAVEISLMSAGAIFGLIALVLGILVCVKMIQNNQNALGIVTILLMLCTGLGSLIVLVVGWVKSKEWNMKPLMTAYTVSFLLSAICVGIGYGLYLPRFVNAAIEEQKQARENQLERDDAWDVGELQTSDAEMQPAD